MTTLTKEMRSQITRAAILEAYKKKFDDMAKLESRLAIEAYNHIFPKKVRDQALAMPDKWVRLDSCLRINAGGWDLQLHCEKSLPVPYTGGGCGRLGSISGDLAIKIQDFSTAKKQAKEDYRNAEIKLTGFLSSFTTVKRLKDAWPEGKKYYESFDVTRNPDQLPAVITTEINAMLGLKSKKGAVTA